MKYMLLIYGNEAAMQAARKVDIEQMMGAYGAYTEALKKAGAARRRRAARGTSAATTVRVTNGKTQVLNGPYAETKSSSPAITSSTCPISTRPVLGIALPRSKLRRDGSPAAPRDVADRDDARGRRDCPSDGRSGCTPQLRQARRLSCIAQSRSGRRRGCAVRGLRGGARRLARERRAAQSKRRGS